MLLIRLLDRCWSVVNNLYDCAKHVVERIQRIKIIRFLIAFSFRLMQSYEKIINKIYAGVFIFPNNRFTGRKR